MFSFWCFAWVFIAVFLPFSILVQALFFSTLFVMTGWGELMVQKVYDAIPRTVAMCISEWHVFGLEKIGCGLFGVCFSPA